MPRNGRIAPQGYLYHIISRGNNSQSVFEDERDFRKYLKIIEKYKEKYFFKLYHYVLMSNHTHLILETTEEGGSLSEIMKSINLSYTLYYQIKYGYTGHLWQGRYKSIIVSKDEYLLACGSYVELNPVRARICENPEDYTWSSYLVYAYGEKDLLVDKHPVYDEMGRDEEESKRNYRKFVKEMLEKDKPYESEIENGIIYGNTEFVEEELKKHYTEKVVKPKGRPRKNSFNPI